MFKCVRNNGGKCRTTPRLGFEALEARRLLAITWEGVNSTDFDNMASWENGQPAADVDVEFDINATQANGKASELDGTETVEDFFVLEKTTDFLLGASRSRRVRLAAAAFTCLATHASTE